MLQAVDASALALVVQQLRHGNRFRAAVGPGQRHCELRPGQSGVGVGLIHLNQLEITEDPAVLEMNGVGTPYQCDFFRSRLSLVSLRDALCDPEPHPHAQFRKMDLAVRIGAIGIHQHPLFRCGVVLFELEVDIGDMTVICGLDQIQFGDGLIGEADLPIGFRKRNRLRVLTGADIVFGNNLSHTETGTSRERIQQDFAGGVRLIDALGPPADAGLVLLHLEANALDLSVLGSLNDFERNRRGLVLHRDAHNTPAGKAGNRNLVQPAVSILILGEIRLCEGAIILGRAVVVDGDADALRPDVVLAMQGQDLQQGVGAVGQTFKGVNLGSAGTVGVIGHVELAITVGLAVPALVGGPLI